MRTAPKSRPDCQRRQVGQTRGEQSRIDKQVQRQLGIQTSELTPAILDDILLLDTLSRSPTLQFSPQSTIEIDESTNQMCWLDLIRPSGAFSAPPP